MGHLASETLWGSASQSQTPHSERVAVVHATSIVQNPCMATTSVGVIDKFTAILTEVGKRPCTLAEIVERTGISRATCHRLIKSMETHGYLAKFGVHHYAVGHLIADLGRSAHLTSLPRLAEDVLASLSEVTGESAYICVDHRDKWLCIADSSMRRVGVPLITVGMSAAYSPEAVSAAMLAWQNPHRVFEACERFGFTPEQLARVRSLGWAQSVNTETQIATVAVPVMLASRVVTAVLAMSGPAGRLTHQPGKTLGQIVMASARRLEAAITDAPATIEIPLATLDTTSAALTDSGDDARNHAIT